MQHTGTFKDRVAQNFIRANREAGTLPAAGVTIASGGNAGMASAWAAGQQGVPATVFVPTTAPAFKGGTPPGLRPHGRTGRHRIRRSVRGLPGICCLQRGPAFTRL
ncbi:pyridoxal-phosphate dependent enzyme [Arthrobacter bambusae]|nr:pyridoxal-phosphate dependent enzyme [Arthrobacter bambusae]